MQHRFLDGVATWKRSALVALVTVAGACPSSGGIHRAPPKLVRAVRTLAFFAGDWHVDARSPGGKASLFTWRVVPTLGGRWLAGRARAPALGVEARDFWGWDDGTRRFVRIYVDSQGTHGTFFSRGWVGDTWRWQGTASVAGIRTDVRETIRRTGPRGFRARWEVGNRGRWRLLRTEVLTRR